MPIFEYACRKCGKEFEAIVQASTKAECPSCHGQELDKQLSVFAVGGHGEADFGGGDHEAHSHGPVPASCGSCGDPRGPGACALDDN